MKILDKNLKFSNLGEIYVGIKKGLINLEEALKLVENNKVLNLSEDDFKAIYSSDGNTSILQTIENRIKERK